MAETAKSSPEYAMLPAGTVIMWGKSGEAKEDFQPLVNCKALGATGATGSFVDCTTLIDTQKQFLSDLPEGPEKTLGFIDDPTNESFTAFLNAAETRETVQFYMELPNGRTATMILALSGWQVNEITAPASEVIQITVNGKQNNIVWGIKDNSSGTIKSVTIDEDSPLSMTLEEAEGYIMKAVVEPASAKVKLSWDSSNDQTAQIERETGKLHPNALGMTEITVTATPEKGTAVKSSPVVVHITPNPVEVTISGDKEVIASAEETYQYKATVKPESDTTVIAWTSSDPEVAAIDGKTGELTAKKAGKVTITASATPASDSNGAPNSATLEVTVKAVPVEITITGDKEVTAGAETYQYKATVKPESDKTVITWKSSDEAVAKIDAKGVLTAIKAGKVTITATATPASDQYGTVNSATLDVTVKAALINATAVAIAAEGGATTVTMGTAGLKITATPTPANANVTYEWVSSDVTKAKFSDATIKTASGLLVPVAAGPTNVSLKVTNQSDGSTVTVTPATIAITVAAATRR